VAGLCRTQEAQSDPEGTFKLCLGAAGVIA
jgi:hypothetical protein